MAQKSKNNNKAVYYAKILIAFSLGLLIYGFILDINNDIRLIDPEYGVKPVSNNEENYVSIDKTNSGENGGRGDTNNVTPPNSQNNPNVSQNPDISQTHVSDNPDVGTLRESIESKYGISIKYGSETDGYSVGGLSTYPVTDQKAISSVLVSLDNILGLYPNGLFREINNGGIPLTIYLVNNYSEQSVTGATDSNYSFANISIAVIYPVDETFYHESYHYIERYILKKGLSYNESVWNSYNPSGFAYGNPINEYSYKSTFSANSYFVNNYAQTAAEEDRASTFEYMMASSKASCLNNGMPVWKKATVMSLTIDSALDSVSPNNTEYWERFL